MEAFWRAYTRIVMKQSASIMSSVVHSDPEILGGMPVFVGTRVPVKSLFDHLEAGDSLDEFLEDFPSVSRAQAVTDGTRTGSRDDGSSCGCCSVNVYREGSSANL